MIKKIWLFLLSFIAIFLAGVSFADLIPYNSHRLNSCTQLKNVEIDNYKVIYAKSGVTRSDCGCEPFYGNFNCCRDVLKIPGEPYRYVEYVNKEGCLPSGTLTIHLLDKSIELQDLSEDNIQDKAIFVGNLYVKSSDYVDDSNLLSDETVVYKIEKYGDDYGLKLIESEGDIELRGDILIKFGIAWILTILIETIVLFAIAKLFRKKDQISNLTLILIGILASTITLPLLWFALPLLIKDGVEYTVIGELLVTLIEIFIIKYGLKVSRGKAILASFICNLCSYLFGLLVF